MPPAILACWKPIHAASTHWFTRRTNKERARGRGLDPWTSRWHGKAALQSGKRAACNGTAEDGSSCDLPGEGRAPVGGPHGMQEGGLWAPEQRFWHGRAVLQSSLKSSMQWHGKGEECVRARRILQRWWARLLTGFLGVLPGCR